LIGNPSGLGVCIPRNHSHTSLSEKWRASIFKLYHSIVVEFHPEKNYRDQFSFFLNLDIDDVTAVEFGLLAGGFVIIEGALDLR
jgi:hypothetical protein